MAEPNEYPYGVKQVTLARICDAPRQRVWRMWTEPAQMAQWWGPKSFTNPVCELDVRPGGRIWIVMHGPKGTPYDDDFPMSGSFREIVPNGRLVFDAVAEDKAGHPLLRAHTTVIFEDHGNQTRLTVQTKGVGIAPAAPQMLAGMQQGWSQSLEKLAELASHARA
jgi:uncharacterized protein YndB with AHSA1/START domain